MTPSAVVGRERLLRLARAIYEGEEVSAKWVMYEFGVSWTQAKADLRMALLYLPVERVERPELLAHGLDPRQTRIRLARRFRGRGR